VKLRRRMDFNRGLDTDAGRTSAVR
jgi:hypothetical protein